MNPLIIPANINDLSPFEQVLLFHRYGDIVFPLDPPAKGKNGKTPIKSVKKRPTAPNEHDLYHQFGNGNNYNVGVYPAKGHVIVNLDAADKDRTRVDAFLNSRSELANVPRVQTGKGYHLHFLSAEPPRTQHKPNIAPAVNFQLITSEHYVVAPPSVHERGDRYKWLVTGEVPRWTPEIATAFNLPEEEEQAPPPPQDRAQENAPLDRPGGVLGLPIPGGERERLDLDFDGNSHLIARKAFKRLAEEDIYFVQGGKLVRYDSTSKSERLSIIPPDKFRSLLDKFFQTFKSRQRGQAPVPATATKDDADLLLASDEMKAELKYIARVVKHPILLSEKGEPEILTTGAHNGVFVDSSDVIPDVPLYEAVPAILDLFRDFKFNTPNDFSRAVAHFLSPALVFGNLLSGRVPMHVVEADHPGSGKGFMQTLIVTIYNEPPGVITNIRRGVGGNDETLSQRLLSGLPFIQFDNWRGDLKSEMLESALTEPFASCRALHRDGLVLTTGVFFMMTSNGADLTPDLASRCSFIRIMKQPDGYQWSLYEGQELSEHVKNHRTYYLGCIYSVLSEWIRQGKPRTAGDHRFHHWAGSMDWILQNLFSLPPLLDGHREIQKQVASPILVFLRAVAIQVEKEGLLGDQLMTSALVELAQRHNLTFPGLKDYDDQAAKTLGIHLGRIFKQSDTLNLDDSYQMVRVTSSVKRDNNKGYNPAPAYVFFRTPGSPDLQDGPTGRGSDKGNPESSHDTPSGGEKDPVSPDSLQVPCQSPASQHAAISRGQQPPPHQGLADQKPPFPLRPLEDNTVFAQHRDSNAPRGENSCGEKNIEGLPGVAGVISVNLSPVVPQPGGETRFILARNNSDLSAIANTLAGISEPLAIELKTYNARDPVSSKRRFKDVALLSIKASGLPPWLIDLKETGYDLGELKDVLQNHEVIAHDAAFVVGFLRTNLELHLKRVWCTLTAVKLANHQLDVDFSYDPGPVLEKYLSVTIPEDPGTTDWGKPLTEDQYRYAAATVEYLHPLKATLEQALIQSHVLPAFQALNAMIPISPFTYEQQLRAVVPPPMTSFIRSTEATNKDDNGHVPSGD